MPERGGHGSGTPREAASEAGARVRAVLDSARRSGVRAVARLPRPARLLWILLAILGGVAVAFDLHGIGLVPLLALPAMAALTDVMFQSFRFRAFRVPDAALATGALLALILPPTVPILQAQVVTISAIAIRHIVRYRERPLLNPAAVGAILGALVFGMAPSWWGSIHLELVVALGVVLALRTPGSWKLPASFLVAYAALSPLGNLVLGEAVSPQVLLLGAVDPSTLFFGLFMVSEPRTALSRPGTRPLYGLSVGIATVFLPAVIPSLAPFVALLLANVGAVAVRLLRPEALEPRTSRKAARRKKGEDARRPAPGEAREWGISYRFAAGLLVFAIVGGLMFASQGPSATPITVFRPGIVTTQPSGPRVSNCSRDNPDVPPDLLSFLHDRLGPSVILSVDTSRGTVVFYDPVHRATITETDMYEDFGYAEFNGDDYAVAGCA